VWLLPSAAVRRERLADRSLSAGTRALYELLADEIEAEVRAAGGHVVPVDGHPRDTVAAVESAFADALAAGPVAAGRAERRALLRYSNRALVEQYRAFFARPWARGSAAETVLPFDCECGDARCTATVSRAIGDFPDDFPADFPDEPVLAHVSR
jgi:hypothetical protein